MAETGEPYAFTGGDPLNLTDPLGLRSCGWNPFCYAGGAYHAVRRHIVTQIKWGWHQEAEEHPLAAQVLRHHSVGVNLTLAGGGGPGGFIRGEVGVAGGKAYASFTAGAGGESPSASATLGLSVSNADQPREVGGPFGYAGGSVSDEDGETAGIGGFAGRGDNNRGIVGGDISVGLGYTDGPLAVPFETHGGASYTWQTSEP